MFNRAKIREEIILGCSALAFMGVLIVLSYAGEVFKALRKK